MNHTEILSQLAVNPTEIVFAITMRSVLYAIVNRLGEKVLKLTEYDLNLARDEVKIAFDDLEILDYIDMGLDSWEIVQHL